MIVCYCGTSVCRPGTCDGCGGTVTLLGCWRNGSLYPVTVSKAKGNAWLTLHSRYASAIEKGVWDERAERFWLENDFAKLIPCGVCGSSWLPISKSFDLSTPERAFWASYEAHKIINQHVIPPNPTITHDQARFLFLNEAPKRDRCIVTVAIGQFRSVLLQSRSTFMRYAEKCNADYYEITDQLFDDWRLEKFRVHRFASRYNQTLYLDADLLIRTSCPDMFSRFSPGYVWMHDDFPLLTDRGYLNSQRAEFFTAICETDPNSSACFNSGVVLCDHDTSAAWLPPTFSLPPGHFGEQLLVEYQAKQLGLRNLPSEFNTQYWMRDFSTRKSTAAIVHWASCKNKAQLMATEKKESVLYN